MDTISPELYVTLAGEGSDEFEEKRSIFIGHAKHVTSEEEAMEFIKAKKKEYADATHNCWAYHLKGGIVARYSDDGEPQGTAGLPVLDVLRKGGLTDAVIVVTRYFGGTLLGAGGLVRAYSASAKAGIDAAGECVMTLCSVCTVRVSYTLYGKLPSLIARCGGVADDTQYADDVTVRFHLPADKLTAFNKLLSEESSGKVQAQEEETRFFSD